MKSRTKIEAFLVFLLLAFSYAYFSHNPLWNGNSRLGLTFALVQEGRLTIDSFHDQKAMYTGDKSLYNGHYYSDKPIGSSLVAALFYFPLYRLEQLLNIELSLTRVKYLLTFFSIGLPSALAGSLLYVLCKQVSGSIFRGFMATMAIFLGTMILPFSTIFFGHQLAGSLLFIAFFLSFQLKVKPIYRRKSIFFLIGFLLGMALITDFIVAPIVMILIAYTLFTLIKIETVDRRSAVILLAISASIPVMIHLAYDSAVFGSPLSVGYAYMANPMVRLVHSQSLFGVGWPSLKVAFFLTMHPAQGLFWQSPVLILALIGIWFMWRDPNYRFESLIAVAAFLSLLVINSGHYMWWGGSSFGPRYLIPMLPFLGLPLVFIPGGWFGSVVILGLISVIQMLIVVSSQILIPAEIYKQIETIGFFAYSSIYSYCLPLLLKGQFSPNIGHKLLGLNSWLSLIPLLLVMVLLTSLFFMRRDHK
jgi:hypothetical protein